VEQRAPWQLARDPSAAAELDRTLASLAEAVRVLSVLLHPYMPSSTQTLLDALGAADPSWDGATFASRGSGVSVEAIEPLFPKR
jgi:methionyl-tRNA synthetase